MECVQGKTIFGGIAIGKVLVYKKIEYQVKREKIEDAEKEIQRFYDARQAAEKELGELYDKACSEVGTVNAQVFEAHIMMLQDEDYNASVENMIRSGKINAEYAVAGTCDNFFKMFDEMEDEYFKARSIDIKDVSDRVIAKLANIKNDKNLWDEPVIIVADELTPSETIQMDKEKILAFVTKTGSRNSHTAILARSMGIPAVTSVDFSKEWEGKMAVVDGSEGKIYIEPDDDVLEKKKKVLEEDIKKAGLLEKLRGKETVTAEGRKINLYANIGNENDVINVLANDAEGIGLFRTEFLFLERNDYPDEQEQFRIYKYVAENLAGRKVIIRTLDIGADKQVDYFHMEPEENPAMGYRAIRICLQRKDIFKTQLRAILRAAAYGNISIMFPMIISVNEVIKAKEILEEAREELVKEGIECGKTEIGIMIETPAAVMISDELAKEVDFFSIGTNDLTQYTLAIDRQNNKLDEIYDAHHPAVIRMIDIVIEAAHRAGIWVGICGELAGDVEILPTLVKMGVDELSVSPAMILNVRNEILNIDMK